MFYLILLSTFLYQGQPTPIVTSDGPFKSLDACKAREHRLAEQYAHQHIKVKMIGCVKGS
jgi:hypothetical protein